jgi:arylsulfatase A-like enzyme
LIARRDLDPIRRGLTNLVCRLREDLWMHRRSARSQLAAVLAIMAAALALAGCVGSSKPSAAVPSGRVNGRPNIVFVLTDDLAMNLVPYLPHLQAIAASGTTFSHYFVVDSLCCPSRAAIFTGLYPHDDGVFTNTGPDGGAAAYDKFGNRPKSFGLALHAAGYQTAFMGKYLNGYHTSDPRPPGWDAWDVAGNGYPEFNYQLNENGIIHSYGHTPRDYLTDVLARKATGFIRSARTSDRPFALEVATFAPHSPWIAAPRDRGGFPGLRAPRGPAFGRTPTDPPHWLTRGRRLTPPRIAKLDAYFRERVAMVQSVDRLLGTIEHALAVAGSLRNTYFVFSSDNGFHLGEYGLMAGKATAFDTDIRVPLVVAGPGVPAGRTVDSMTTSIDLAPTFLQIAGTRAHYSQDGVSLLPLLHAPASPPDWQQAVLVEHHRPLLADGDPDRQSHPAGNPPSYEAMRSSRFLYVEYATGEREYYDLRHDPAELHNLAGDLSPDRLTALHSALHQLAVCHGASACERAAQLHLDLPATARRH